MKRDEFIDKVSRIATMKADNSISDDESRRMLENIFDDIVVEVELDTMRQVDEDFEGWPVITEDMTK